jgi:hypothetical protein
MKSMTTRSLVAQRFWRWMGWWESMTNRVAAQAERDVNVVAAAALSGGGGDIHVIYKIVTIFPILSMILNDR